MHIIYKKASVIYMYNYHQELIKNSRNNSVEPSNKKQVQQQKKFNIKNFKKNTCKSLNDVENFLCNFSNTLKYIKLIKLLK